MPPLLTESTVRRILEQQREQKTPAPPKPKSKPVKGNEQPTWNQASQEEQKPPVKLQDSPAAIVEEQTPQQPEVVQEETPPVVEQKPIAEDELPVPEVVRDTQTGNPQQPIEPKSHQPAPSKPEAPKPENNQNDQEPGLPPQNVPQNLPAAQPPQSPSQQPDSSREDPEPSDTQRGTDRVAPENTSDSQQPNSNSQNDPETTKQGDADSLSNATSDTIPGQNPVTSDQQNDPESVNSLPSVQDPPNLPSQPTSRPDIVDGNVNSSGDSSIPSANPQATSPKTIMMITIPVFAVAPVLIAGLLIIKRRNRVFAAANGPSRLNSALAKATRSISSWFQTHENGDGIGAIFTKERVPVLGLSWLQPKLARYTRKISSWFETHRIIEPAIVPTQQDANIPVVFGDAEVITTLTKIRDPNSTEDGSTALNAKSKNEGSFFPEFFDIESPRPLSEMNQDTALKSAVSTIASPLVFASIYLRDLIYNLRQKSFNFSQRF